MDSMMPLSPTKISSIYRRCLLHVGKRGTTPVHMIETAILAKDKPEQRFLRKCRLLFDNCSDFDQRLLRVEIFERGVYYRYWYVGEMTYRDYGVLLNRYLVVIMGYAIEEGLL